MNKKLKNKKNICSERDMDNLMVNEMPLMDKLEILSDAAKYDVACTSSGVERKGNGKDMGNCKASGICHSFSAEGRCIRREKPGF